MKLLRCYIENFGKLQNETREFNDGLNIIKEANGYGKTTFATFIKSMFYGLDASNKTEKSDRVKYKPWQGGIFGGNIEFEIQGKRYRIERFFGTKASDDTFKIYDLDTNLESRDYTENIGEEIFKISKAAYQRSTYIPQNQIQIEMEDSISAKLGNILENENDVNTSKQAIEKIKDTMSVYKKSGNKGILNQKEQKLNELKRELEKCKFDDITLQNLKNKAEEKKQEIQKKQELKNQKQNLLSRKIEQGRKQAKQETYNNILNKLKENEDRYNELNEFFKGNIIEDNFIDELNAKCVEIEKSKVEITNSELLNEELSKLNELKDKFENKEITEEEIDNKIKDCSKLQEIEGEIQTNQNEIERLNTEIVAVSKNIKEKKTKASIMGIIGLIAVILGIAMVVLKIQNIVGIGVAVFGIVFIMVALINGGNKKAKTKYEGIEQTLKQLNLKLKELQDSKDELNSGIEQILATYIPKKVDINERVVELTNLKTEYNIYVGLMEKKKSKDYVRQMAIAKKEGMEREVKEALLNYFDNIDKPYTDLVQELKLKKNNLINAIQDMDKSRKLKEDYEKANNVEELKQDKDVEAVNEQELAAEIKSLSLELDKLSDEKNQYKNQIEVLENKIDENEYLETDIENLKEQISEMSKRYMLLEKAKELLEKAKETFNSNYLQEMTQGFRENLNILDKDNELSTDVDINLDVKIDVNGAKKDVKYFSTGYKDLIYICMRFSLIKALFKEECPFIILDDPLVNLDEEKTAESIELINKLAEKYQIIYFVCNGSRV